MVVRRKLRSPQAVARGRARKWRSRMVGARRRMGAPSVYKFKEPYQISTPITIAPNASNSGLIVGQLSALTNFANYQGLFDLYRITGMKVTFLPTSNVASPSAFDVTTGGYVVPGQLPLMYLAPNRDPYVPAPTGVYDILNDDGVKSFRLDRKRSFFLKFPKPDIRSADGTASLPIVLPNKIQAWLQTGGNHETIDQSMLKHFGYRWVVDNTANPNTYIVQTQITLYFQMKERD